MKIDKEHEILFGKSVERKEVTFFVKDVTDIGYDTKSECEELKFFVVVGLEQIYISENDFKYLLNKYRGNTNESNI